MLLRSLRRVASLRSGSAEHGEVALDTSQWQRLRSAKLINAPLCYGVLKNRRAHVQKADAGGRTPSPFIGRIYALCWGCRDQRRPHKTTRARSQSQLPSPHQALRVPQAFPPSKKLNDDRATAIAAGAQAGSGAI